jgi:hypothetical protein
MAELVQRTGRGLVLILGTVFLAACSATPAPTPRLEGHPTAVAACTDAVPRWKESASGWQVAVEIDRGTLGIVAFVSGDAIAWCQAGGNLERTSFDIIEGGTGTYPITSPPTLSYLTSAAPSGKTSILVGRVPPDASAVRVAFADGSKLDAALGGDLWLTWLEQPADVSPVAIEALDAAGSVTSRLEDPDGIQPAG